MISWLLRGIPAGALSQTKLAPQANLRERVREYRPLGKLSVCDLPLYQIRGGQAFVSHAVLYTTPLEIVK